MVEDEGLRAKRVEGESGEGCQWEMMAEHNGRRQERVQRSAPGTRVCVRHGGGRR